MVNIKRYQQIDKQIKEIWKIRSFFLKYLTPVNLKEEKRKFLSDDKVEEPIFIYRKLDFNPQKIIDLVKSIDVSTDDILTEPYQKYLAEEINKNEFLLNIGNRTKLLDLSTKIYGIPEPKYIELAKSYLANYEDLEIVNKDIQAKEAKRFLEKKLLDSKLTDWKVEIEKSSNPTSVNLKRKTISISEDRVFSKESLDSISSHEIEGHVFKSFNATLQKFLIFKGFPDYIQTEEGVAIYLESRLSQKYKRNKGALIFVVDQILSGASFRQSFNKLLEYNLPPENAFNNCYRVYRGGGITKDFVYLQGFERVKEFLENGGNIRDLYYGKYDIKHLPIINELKKQGLLIEPKYLPSV